MRGLTLIFLFFSCMAYSQFADDFSDGNLSSDPEWSGDASNFKVNEDFQLQLDAPDGGTSFLYAPIILEDSTEWNLFFDLDFNPSGGNMLRIYLAIDQIDLAVAKGYFLEIGEDGSNDAIKLYAKEGNSTTLLGTGTMAAVAVDPARARVSIKKSLGGEWLIKADYEGGNILLDDLLVMDNSIDISGNQFFGFECTYTSTRADKFFFDDISIQVPVQDLTPPSLVSATLIDDDQVLLQFDELLSDNSESTAIVNVEPGNIPANSVTIDPSNPTQLIVTLSEALNSGTLYNLCIEKVSDQNANLSSSECKEIFLTVDPEIGDLFVNEILFNPNTGGADFVEIINTSEKFITLDRVSIFNDQNEQSDPIRSGIVMKPNDILAFTTDPDSQIDTYNPSSPENIIQQELPAFNVDEGNVSLLLAEVGEIVTLDAFTYLDDYHFVLIDNVKGVSLEKIFPSSESDNSNSWHSAAETVGFATPGYSNSSQIGEVSSSDMVSFPLKVFSPNEDGMDDLFAVTFNIDEPGYLASVKIFNDRGQLVKIVSNNMLLSTESHVLWNGITDEGSLADIGIYIVLVELFNANGKVQSIKESFVLADFLD